MKRFYSILIFSVLALMGNAQGYDITIKINDLQVDSIRLRNFNENKYQFQTINTQKFSNELSFKGKKSLLPGYYTIIGDTNELVSFFISDKKNQKFSIEITQGKSTFKNSPENSARLELTEKNAFFNQQIKDLDEEFAKMQKNNLPKYMMQPMVDTLVAKALRINKAKRDYHDFLIMQHKGTLLASFIQLSKDLPEPPPECYRNRELYYIFLADTMLSEYPWEDERLLSTPFSYVKFENYAKIIFTLPQEKAIPYLLKTFDKSKISTPVYHAYFDYIEKKFGNLTSLYRDEKLYIPMLKYALQDPLLDIARKTRYEYELNIIDKNNENDILPDFPLLLSTGDTTTLHNINAEFILVYFQNPDCPTCTEVREKMKNMPLLNKAIENKRLTVLTVFFEENENLWQNYLVNRANPSYIHGWNYTLNIETQQLYDTRTIPMMMLADKDKKIIKKDILYNDLEPYIQQLGLDK